MFVICRGCGGCVVVHRAECALLDERYAGIGERHSARTLTEAKRRADRLARPAGIRHQLCGWCRPESH